MAKRSKNESSQSQWYAFTALGVFALALLGSVFQPSSDVAVVPQLKLSYFAGAGRAEVSRLVFHFGGVAFKDERLNHPDFLALKPTLPLGQMPVLEVDGVTYSQSMAIVRYAAKLTGLMPKDPLEALNVDMISESLVDMQTSMSEVAYRIKDEALKAEKTKLYLEETLPKHLKMLESKVLGQYFLDDKPTYADVQLFNFIENSFKVVFADTDLSAYPKLLAVVEQVKTNPGVAAYLAARAN